MYLNLNKCRGGEEPQHHFWAMGREEPMQSLPFDIPRRAQGMRTQRVVSMRVFPLASPHNVRMTAMWMISPLNGEVTTVS